ncbi:glycerol kinase GlpK, partial [bacterium]|nr:glycerol kinase GlpK [bacterium]
ERGQAIYPAIVWQDRRTADICQRLREAGHEETITAKTGLLLDPYFSATKIAWILDHVPGARQRAEAGELAFGTIESYLLWKLTEGRVHATDVSNASRTSLLNIHSLQWDAELLSLFDVPQALMPEVRGNAEHFGDASAAIIGHQLPITGMAGDQQAALVGQACFTPGMVKSTYGTGCFALMHAGDDPKPSAHRLLTTVAYQVDKQTCYAIEGSIFVAGAAIQWLRDGLHAITSAPESEFLATSVDDNHGVYFVPALTGLGAPYWCPEARGQISGITRDTQKAHIVRAALEAQAYQTRDLIEAMQSDVGAKPSVIRADGGLVANQFMCQFLADVLAIDIDVPAVTEATAWGAAALAGLHVGVFENLAAIADVWQRDRVYRPAMPREKADAYYAEWKEAVGRLL